MIEDKNHGREDEVLEVYNNHWGPYSVYIYNKIKAAHPEIDIQNRHDDLRQIEAALESYYGNLYHFQNLFAYYCLSCIFLSGLSQPIFQFLQIFDMSESRR